MLNRIKERLRRLKIWARRISVRFVLICLAVIIPANLLSVGFCVLLYRSYQNRIVSDYDIYLGNFASDLDRELGRTEEAVSYLFASESFNPFVFDEFSDPALASVALKNLLSQIETANFANGIRYVWNKNDDIISFFHRGDYYSYEAQRMLEEIIRERDAGGSFDRREDILSVDGVIFAGTSYTIRNYELGIYMDMGHQLESFYSGCMEPKGTLILTDMSGEPICAWGIQGFTKDYELPPDRDRAFTVERDLSVGSMKLLQIVERREQGQLSNMLPFILFAVIGLTALTFLMMPLIYIVSDRMMIRPVSKMLGAMERIGEGDLTVRLPETASSADIEFMNKRFNLMVTEIKELRIKSYEQEIEKLKTDAINLKLQVDPHMFLNCLNVMYSLGRTGRTEQVCDFSVQLMNYFRYSLRSDAEFSSLREELNFVTSYLNIQKVRFPDRFTYSFDIQKEAESIQIPRLLVENFVENVVKYAMRCDGITHILISAKLEEGRLRVVIADTGNGMDESVLRQINSRQVVEDSAGRHTGIWNSRRRLDFYYNDDYSLTVRSQVGEGTQVEIIVPEDRPVGTNEPKENVHIS